MLVGAILGFVFREKVVQTMRQEMYSSLNLYGNRRGITLAWDETQTRLKCCGVESYRDWYGSIPESCCQETYGGQRKPCIDAPSPLTLHVNGCRNVTTEFIRQHAAIISGAGITVAAFLIFAQIFSLILFKMIEWAAISSSNRSSRKWRKTNLKPYTAIKYFTSFYVLFLRRRLFKF